MRFEFELDLVDWPSAANAELVKAAEYWADVIRSPLPPTATRSGRMTGGIRLQCFGRVLSGLNASCQITERRPPKESGKRGPMPKAAELQLCSTRVEKLKADGRLGAILRHELGHALGIGTLWSDWGYVKRAGKLGLYTGSRGVEAYRDMGGTGAGVPLDLDPSAADNIHWSEKHFGDELMTTRTTTSASPLSRLTVASLRDLGYDDADWEKAQAFDPKLTKPSLVQSLGVLGLSALSRPGVVSSHFAPTDRA